MTEREFEKLRKRKGYGVQSSVGRPLKSQVGDTWKVSDMEQRSWNESLAEKRLALRYTGRPILRFKVYRKRLTDMPRSDCEKYYVDGIAYAGLVEGDSEKQIRFEDGGHEKVEKDSEERVEIELIYDWVDYINPWKEAK